ncbi:MAG TPA: hypothetical protein VEH30_08335 [Terriglobales bacterium]|nr:hypothetical protein [Terriglobales bacterium]
MSDTGYETRLHRRLGWLAELLATAFVTLMTLVSTLRLLGILS